MASLLNEGVKKILTEDLFFWLHIAQLLLQPLLEKQQDMLTGDRELA